MITVLAATGVFAAVWFLSLPPPATLRLSTVLNPSPDHSSRPPTHAGQTTTTTARPGVPPESPTGARRTTATALWPLQLPGRPAGTAQAATVAWLRHTVGAIGRRRRETAKRRTAVIELCDGIAAELTAGRPPNTALSYAAESLPDIPGLSAVIEAAQNGDDVPAALTQAADTEGCDGLRLLAGCWRVGVDRGGMLAAVIEGLAEALRDEQSHRDEVALELAGPRATARLLAGLPLLGLGMAAALGAKPLAFLFATLPGALCLTVGIGLDALGLWWTSRLATAAEQTQ